MFYYMSFQPLVKASQLNDLNQKFIFQYPKRVKGLQYF